MPHKITFDDPLVKFKMNSVRFPKICPVCGKKATTVVRMSFVPGRKRALTAFWDPMYMGTRMRKQLMPDAHPRTLIVPVCEDHRYSSDDYCRARTLCITGGFIFSIIAWFAFLNIVNPLTHGQPGPTWAYLILAGFAVVLGTAWVTFRPREVERVIKIIGFDAALEDAVVEFKNKEYQEAFLRENPHSQLISWIVKG